MCCVNSRNGLYLIYLNELPEGAGGDTTFPRLHLSIRPEKHTALVFNDVLDNGMDDERTEHSGTAPAELMTTEVSARFE